MRNAQFEESAIAPVRPPRVLNEPVASTVFVVSNCAITYHGYCMVDYLGFVVGTFAVAFFQETGFVAHEATRVGMHGYTNWTLGQELFQSIIGYVIFLKLALVEVSDLAFNFLAFFLRGLVLIRIVFLFQDTISFSESIGVKHPAATTAEVTFITVNQLLH